MSDFADIYKRYTGQDYGTTTETTTPQPQGAGGGFDDLMRRYTGAPATNASQETITVAQPSPLGGFEVKEVPKPKQTTTPPPKFKETTPESSAARGDRLAEFQQGLEDVANTIAKARTWAGKNIPVLGRFDTEQGFDPQSVVDELNQRRQQFESSGGESGLWRSLGQQAITAPITVGAGMGARALAAGVPYVAPAVNFLTGGGGVASQAATGAEANALNALLTGQDVGQAAKEGALVAGGLRLAQVAPSAVGQTVRGVRNLLTDTGAGNIANDILSRYTGGAPLVAREIVPGSQPTLADVANNPAVSGLQRTARDLPEFNPRIVAREEERHAARNNFFNNVAGSEEDVVAAKQARDQLASQQLPQIFENAGPANPLPVIEKIDEILAGPGGKRTAVAKTLTDLRKQFITEDRNGFSTLVTDPAQLYQSGRKEIGDKLENALGPGSDKAALQSSRELKEVQSVLDKSINDAAPGFSDYLSNYSAASKPIDAMSYLQGLNIRDAHGNITLSKVQSALDRIAKQRNQPGANAAKALDDQHIETLTNIRDDLLNESNLALGKSKGSPTVQNAVSQYMLNDLLPGGSGRLFSNKLTSDVVGALGGAGLGHLVGGSPWGSMVGSAVGTTIGHGIRSALDARNQAIRNALIDRLLEPSLYTPSATTQGANLLLPGEATAAAAPLLSQRVYPQER